MSLEQVIVAVIVALIGTASGVLAERVRSKREREKETSVSVTSLQQAHISDEALKRKEIDEAARDIREFLRRQVAGLNEAIDKIEIARAGEQEKWHQMLAELSIKNLELELQHRRDTTRIEDMLEEAKVIDDEVKNLKSRVAVFQSEAIIMSAKLGQAIADRDRLQRTATVVKEL